MMRDQDRATAAASLREMADAIEAGGVDAVFAVTLSGTTEGGSYDHHVSEAAGTNIDMAHAIGCLADRIECCTSGDCFPGSIKAAVEAVTEKFTNPGKPAVLN